MIRLLAFIFLLTSCKTLPDFSGAYKVLTVNGQSVADHDFSLRVNGETKEVSGKSGCNSYFGKYSIVENQLEIGPLAGTKMYCTDTGAMERTYLDALASAKNVTLENDILTLLDGETKLLITAQRAKE